LTHCEQISKGKQVETTALIGRLTSRLLSVDTVFRGVQRALKKSLSLRKTMDRNIERVLAGANLPSARDVDRVSVQLKELDRELGEIAKRAESLKSE
jgi:hypothetical protein